MLYIYILATPQLVSLTVSSAEHEASVLSLCYKTVCDVFISSVRRRLSRTITPCPSLCSPGGLFANTSTHSEQESNPVPSRGSGRPTEEATWHPESQDDARLGAGGTCDSWRTQTGWHADTLNLEQYCKLRPTWSLSLFFIDVWANNELIDMTDCNNMTIKDKKYYSMILI